VHWALGRREIFVNSAGDLRLLPHLILAAQSFGAAPGAEEMRAQQAAAGLEPIFVRGYSAGS
jgi:hypothetical protein